MKWYKIPKGAECHLYTKPEGVSFIPSLICLADWYFNETDIEVERPGYWILIKLYNVSEANYVGTHKYELIENINLLNYDLTL